MKLTADNYFSKEANMEYLSNTQYKSFMGCSGIEGCEARAMAELNGEWHEEPTTSLLVGSYADAYFEGTMPKFKKEHPEIFTQKGELRSEYKRANTMIERCESDPYFMLHMSGQKQVIMTAEMFGAKWKIKMDVYFPQGDKNFPNGLIVDFKTTKSINKPERAEDGSYLNFALAYGYDVQGAVYQRVCEIATGRVINEPEDHIPFKLAVVSKETYPDIEIIQIEQDVLDNALAKVEANTPTILALKNKEIDPIRCGKCDYCKSTKKLDHTLWQSELLGEI